MPKLRVMIIGAGRRVQNNFLPSLRCLEDRFEVVGVHARTIDKLLPVTECWAVPACPTFDIIDWSEVDVVVVSVPTAQNVSVLRQLRPHASRLRLVIDTPVATTLAELIACSELLPEFKQVLVTEDYMNFPQFALARRAFSDGLIGKAQSATLLNIGYFFHGLALIRSFADFAPVLASHTESVGQFTRHVFYRLRGGFRACVVGPYRPEENGGLLLEGSEGIISDLSSDARWGNRAGRPLYTIRGVNADGNLAGFKLENAVGEHLYDIDLPQLRLMRDMPFEDKSTLNLCRGCGLMDIFLALIQQQNMNHRYGYDSALYDSLMSRIAYTGRFNFDPFVMTGSNLIAAVSAIGRWRNVPRRLFGEVNQ